MKLIKNYLSQRNDFPAKNIDEKTIFYITEKIIKEEFGNIGRDKLKPDFYKNKTVFIKTDNSIWAAELWLNKNKIIKKINTEIGVEIVLDIKTKNG